MRSVDKVAAIDNIIYHLHFEEINYHLNPTRSLFMLNMIYKLIIYYMMSGFVDIS